MKHIPALKVTSISVTPLQGVEMIAVVGMEGALLKNCLFVRLPLVDAKGSSKIPNCNEDINYFYVDQRSLMLRSLNFIVEIWAKEFLDEKTSKDKKIGDEKTGGEKKAGDQFSLMKALPGSKKVGNVLIPIEELLRNKAGGNEHSGSYVLRRASGEAKVMLSLSVKIVDVTMPNDSDTAADGATYSTYQPSPPQPNTVYLPPPGSSAYTQGAYSLYNQACPFNPYIAPSNRVVHPISHHNNFYPQGYPPYHPHIQGYPGYPPYNPHIQGYPGYPPYNPHIQGYPGYPSFHGYSHAPQQCTSTLEWVRTGLNIVHDCLLLAGSLGGPILDGFGGE